MASPSRAPTEKVIIEDPSTLNEDVSSSVILDFHFSEMRSLTHYVA